MSHTASTWIAETLAVWAKEWRTELRTRVALNTVALFAFMTLMVTSLTLGPIGTSRDTVAVLPVILWLILLFAATAGLPRSFVHEEEVQTATALRLSATPSCLLAGKAGYNLTLLLALELLVVPLYLLLLQMPVEAWGTLVVTLLAGGYGMAIGSTLIAAMVAQASSRGPLFAVLAFPILLPLLLFAVKGTLAAVLGEPGNAFVQLLLMYDGTLTVAGLMLFPVIWNPS